jgi:8-oxo-dGTP diphosphatase
MSGIIKGVTFALVNLEMKNLMQLRNGKPKHYPNTWVFPGGHIDEGETVLDALVREAKEEFNLDIKKESCLLLMAYRLPYSPHNLEEVFVCLSNGQEDLKLNEGAAMEWMDLKK